MGSVSVRVTPGERNTAADKTTTSTPQRSRRRDILKSGQQPSAYARRTRNVEDVGEGLGSSEARSVPASSRTWARPRGERAEDDLYIETMATAAAAATTSPFPARGVLAKRSVHSSHGAAIGTPVLEYPGSAPHLAPVTRTVSGQQVPGREDASYRITRLPPVTGKSMSEQEIPAREGSDATQYTDATRSISIDGRGPNRAQRGQPMELMLDGHWNSRVSIFRNLFLPWALAPHTTYQVEFVLLGHNVSSGGGFDIPGGDGARPSEAGSSRKFKLLMLAAY